MFNTSYQREQMVVRVDADYNKIVNCNYLMYQNQEFSNKWFYAFITRIEYKNDDLSLVYFEIDSYQTFMFDITIHPSFVEREHVNDDSVGANIIDEGLALGDFVCNEITEHYFTNWWIVAGLTVDINSPKSVVSGKYYGGVFSGVRYYAWDSYQEFNAMLDTLQTGGANPAEVITIVYMVPTEIVSPNQESGAELEVNPAPSEAWNWPRSNSLNGYVPRNNKLLCYPFRYCELSNLNGQSATLRYEFEALDAGGFRYQGNVLPDSKIWCWPQGYKGVPDNIDEGISLGAYPVCTWVANTYASWLAQKQTANAMALSSAVINSGYVAMTGGAAAANTAFTGSLIGLVTSNMKEGVTHSFSPAQARGNASSESTAIARDQFGFRATGMSITADYAKTIDDYMWAYGYAVKKVKVPNVTGRSYWNYVKCSNAVITGNCPIEHLTNIKNMFTKGVTFWHGDYVGDYTLNNSTGQTPPEPDYYYTLNVIGGTGAGQYKGNTQVNVAADEPTRFKNWSSNGGGTFADPNSANTVYTMPFNNVTVTANYDDPTPTENLADYASQFIGAVEWDDTVRLWQTWYYGSYVKDAWCTTFLTYCAAMIGKGDQVPKNAAVQALYNQMHDKGKTWAAVVGGRLPKKGDICFNITSQSTTVLHHCGVVTNVHSDGVTFDYVSGNTGNPVAGKPDGVFIKTMTIGKTTPSYTKYFGEVN